MTKGNIKALSKINQFVTRPTTVAFNKIDYLNHEIVHRKLNPKDVSSGFLGEHFSLPKYDEDYYQPNFNETRHILCHTANNSTSKWTCGLRGFSTGIRKNARMEKSPTKETSDILKKKKTTKTENIV